MELKPIEKSFGMWLKQTTVDKKIEKCPICDNSEMVVRDEIKKEKCKLIQCKRCGFLTYSPQPENAANYYREEIRVQSAEFQQTKKNKIIKLERSLFKFLDSSKIKIQSVFDFGCGDGYLLKEFETRYGTKTFGIELNKGHRNWAKYVNGIDVTDDYELKKMAARYQLLILYHVLEHLQEPKKQMEKLLNCVEDGGYIYVALPTLNKLAYPEAYSTKHDNTMFKDEHLNIFTDELLEQFLLSFNLKKVYENKTIYGTAYMLQKLKKGEEAVTTNYNLYDQNNKLFEKTIACYAIKSKFDEALLQDRSRAQKLGVEAAKYQDNFPELICKLAATYDPSDQQDLLEDQIRRYPDSIEYHSELGYSYLADQDFEQAESVFKNAIKIFGFDVMLYTNLAYALYYQRKFEESIHYLRDVILRNGDHGAVNVLASVLLNV